MTNLAITDNAAGSPQHAPLSGIGTTAKLSPTSFSFGTVAIGTASPGKTVTLTNVGTATLTITGVAITGTNAGDFVSNPHLRKLAGSRGALQHQCYLQTYGEWRARSGGECQ